VPDISLPSTWDIETVGESSYPTALEWDRVRPYRHNKFPLNYNKLKTVRELHKKRLNIDPNLLYLGEVRKRYDDNKNKKELSLNINERINEKNLRKSWLLEIENKRRLGLGLKIYDSYEALKDSEDEELIDRNNIDLENDFLLIESTKIIGDYLDLNKKIVLTKVN
jgi:carboxyl-terminal processing protease